MTCRFATTVCLTAAALLFAVASVDAQSYGKAPRPGSLGPEAEIALRVDQKLGDTIPLDGIFYDQNRKPVALRQLIDVKPTLIVPFYSSCPRLCHEVLIGLLQVLRDMRAKDAEMSAGKAFNVVLVSIDGREAPALASSKRAEFLLQYDRRQPDEPGVWFLTAGHGQGTDVAAAEKTIHELTNAIGFPFVLKYRGTEYQYRPDPRNGEQQWLSKDDQIMKGDRTSFGRTDDYFHPAAVVVVTPSGKISRYLLGVGFDASTMQRAIEIAGNEGVAAKDDGQRAPLCSNYDETKDHYKPAMRILGFVAAPFVLLVLGIAGYSLRKSRREHKLVAPESEPTNLL